MKLFLLNVLVILCILFSINSNAQVSGILKDQNNSPVAFANVIALNFSDSSIVKAAISDDDGRFELNDLPKDKYYIKVIMLGYADYFSEPIDLNAKSNFNLSIKLQDETTNLDEFNIVAKKPFLEQQAGKMIVNVSDNISGINGSMMKLMKKVPGVLVINKKLSLAGNQNVTILINGKTTQYLDMQTLMSELPASDIEKIEVISQPDATMDATGTGGVINIILKKNKLSGTNGSVWSGFGYGEIEKYYFGTSINHRKDKYNIYSSAGYSYNTGVENMILERRIGTDTYFQNTYQPDFPNTFRINGGIDYDITENQMVGIALTHVTSDNNRTNINNTSIVSSLNDTIYRLKTFNTIKRRWNYNSAVLNYDFDIDSLGQKLEFSSNYSSYIIDGNNTITTNANYDVYYPTQKNNEPGKTHIYATKLDYKLPFNKKLVLSSGLKYSYANVDSDLQAYIENGSNNGYMNNTALSNHFIFKEQIYAGYLKQEFNTKKVSLQGGLRYEHSISDGYSVTIDSTTQRTISKLFPSAGISVPITKSLGASLGYSYRIQRPSYSTLNPFISYLDPYTFEKGNTNLRPELTHSAKFSLTYDHQPFFNIEYSNTSDVLMLVTEQDDNSGVSYATTANLKSYKKYGGSFFFPLDFIKPLEGYGGIMTNYHIYDAPYLDDIYNREKFTYTLFIEASAEIIKTLTIEGGGWYQSGGIEGIMDYNSLYGVSFGVEKTFFEEKLSLSMSIEDIFYDYWTANIDYSNMDVDIESRWETRVFYVNLSYKFGNRFLKKRKFKKNSAQEELNRANQKK